MTERKRLYLLILVMSVVALIVSGITMSVLYRAAMRQERDRLMESAQSQARLIEAVARFDAVQSADFPQGSVAATISQVVDAHKHYKAVGETGEFTLARREKDQIVFLLRHRHTDLESPNPIPWSGKLAEPMRRALSGISGTVVALDYRGETVLAAHEPVSELDLGIVAKIDIAEVRAPFVRAGLIAVLSAVAVVFLASLVFLHISNPIVMRIQEQHAELTAILKTAADGIIAIDTEGKIESFNPAAERIFGHAAEDVIGQNIKMLMPPSYSVEHDGYLAAYLQTGNRKIIGVGREVVGSREDGSEFPMDLAVSEVRVGERRFFTGIVRDITERKHIEQNRRLAAMGQLLTVIAHESRNALQRIQAAIAMLRLDAEGNPDLLDPMNRIEKASDNLSRLYEELREYAAPINLTREPSNLREIWRLAWANLGHVRRDREIELRDEANGIDLGCHVDGFRIEQVFRNLLENSLAACSDPAEITIVCHEAKLGDSPALRINLSDNGPGLTDQQRQKIFEPFFTTKSKGTGLGMAIARRIIEAHNGRITVSDTCPKGAEFVITLPRDS